MDISVVFPVLLIATAASASVPSLIPAQEAEVTLAIVAGIRGTCRSFTIGDRSGTCSTVLYQQYSNGRGVFLLPIGKGLFALSGGSDERTSPTDYVLHLDAVRIAQEDGEVMTHDAAGECRVKTNRGADRFDRIDCDARADVLGEIHLRFVGNGKRADIQIIKPRR
jgi:hypothetical protein